MKKRSIEQSEFWRKYHGAMEDFAGFMPNLFAAINDADCPVHGLTFFTGDGGHVVVGIRRLSPEGVREVVWTSGEDFILAFLAVESTLPAAKWKPDKR